ncbi:hypothetical protein UlMin_011480 [Ulmus minor]
MPSMEIVKSISGIKLPFSFPKIKEGLCRKFAFDHSAGLIALRTENYCIQFYSLFDDRIISEVQVCERNHQPGDEVTVAVTSIALSQDGSTMCTTEVKLTEEGIGALVCLKFWASDLLNKQFSMSTIIYEPHRQAEMTFIFFYGDAEISAVVFHPSRQMAVTASYGGDFKKPMTDDVFSADGSVLAVAAKIVITLWDPKNNALVTMIGETQMARCSLQDGLRSVDDIVPQSIGSQVVIISLFIFCWFNGIAIVITILTSCNQQCSLACGFPKCTIQIDYSPHESMSYIDSSSPTMETPTTSSILSSFSSSSSTSSSLSSSSSFPSFFSSTTSSLMYANSFSDNLFMD